MILNQPVLRLKAGDPLGAIEEYTRAIAVDPKHTRAHAMRGVAHTGCAYAKIGNGREHLRAAVQDLEKALELGGMEGDYRRNVQETLRAAREMLKDLGDE